MDDLYIDKIHKYENMCQSWIQKADEEYILNDCRHTKQECVYLQKAVSLRAEMARISMGEEQLYHRRKAQELNVRIADIIREVDPDYLKRLAEKKKQKKEESEAVPAPQNQDDEVKNWFKELPKHSFQDVSGMEGVKQQLKECVLDSRLQELKEFLGMKKLHSYFFIGPPGCGKTYIIEAFAHELADKNYKYLSLTGSDILSKYVGDAEKIVTKLFEEAEKNAPCLVFIDEIDGICKNRSLPNLPEYAASITTSFLTGYNKIHSSDKPIIFIGATNYPRQVDNAMLDRVELVRIPFPDAEARKHAFAKEFEHKITLKDITLDEMAERTDMYNYRDIQRLTGKIKQMILKKVIKEYPNEKDALRALKEGNYGLTREVFEEVLGNCLPTPKDSIVRELDEWEESFKKSQEE